MVNFKVVERGEPGISGGGEKKWYASIVCNNELSIEDLTRSIEKMCTVNGADIRAVLYALVDVSITALEKGEIVRLGYLGSMRMGINSDGMEKKEDVTASCIKKAHIIFTPGKNLRSMLSTMKYTKV